MLASNHARANPAKAVAVQKIEAITVAAQRPQELKLESIVVTASRKGAQL